MSTVAAAISLDLHGRLRSATRPLHDAAEAAFAAERRFSSLEAYADLLDRLWSLHEGAERAAAVHSRAVGLDLQARSRSPLLALDLQAVAGRAPCMAPEAFDYPTPAAALGGLYVLEGSTLGGRALVRLARTSLGVTRFNGGRFLEGAGAQTGPRWRAFLAALNRVPADSPDAGLAEAAACATFRRFVVRLGTAAPSGRSLRPA